MKREVGGRGGGLHSSQCFVVVDHCRTIANDQSHEPLSLKTLSVIGTLISSSSHSGLLRRRTIFVGLSGIHPKRRTTVCTRRRHLDQGALNLRFGQILWRLTVIEDTEQGHTVLR